MFGGGKFPAFPEGNHTQYGSTTMPQLQLIGNDSFAVPVQYGGGIGMLNYAGNEQAPSENRPVKRVREEDPVYMQHNKLGISLNNNVNQVESGHNIGTLLNPNLVSTGLKLSCEKEERSFSVTSTCENIRNTLPDVLSLGNNTVKTEIDRQTEEFSQYIKLQEEKIYNGVRDLHQRQTLSFLNALEKGVNRKLQEKDLEIENANLKNKELDDKIKQVTIEAQSWHDRAKHNESVANVLKSNIQQLLMAQGRAQGPEASRESEVDDAFSCSNQEHENHRLKCRACKEKRVSVVLFPCRHLCLCGDCEGFIDVCPVCMVVKSAGVHVYM